MKRRDFIAFLGGAAAAWPLAVRAQQPERVRHIGMLNALGSDDPEAQARIAVLEQTLQQLGWVVGRNLKIEIRQIGGDVDRLRSYAAELVALAPDVIFTIGSVAVGPLQQATRTIPIVFVNAADPVGAGFVQSMAHPGGNITGFSNFEYSMSGKWAELLKQIAPNVTRALVLRDPTSAAGIGQFAAIRSVAQSLGIELTPVNVRDTDEIERNVAAFARSGNGGMIVTSGGTGSRRKLISVLPLATNCRRFIPIAITPLTGAWSHTDPTRSIRSGEPRGMSIASSRARNRPTCRCRHRPSMSWFSISRPQRRSA